MRRRRQGCRPCSGAARHYMRWAGRGRTCASDVKDAARVVAPGLDEGPAADRHRARMLAYSLSKYQAFVALQPTDTSTLVLPEAGKIERPFLTRTLSRTRERLSEKAGHLMQPNTLSHRGTHKPCTDALPVPPNITIP